MHLRVRADGFEDADGGDLVIDGDGEVGPEEVLRDAREAGFDGDEEFADG